MKLAEALAMRNGHQAHIQDLEQRLRRSSQVQMGDNPPENPEELLSDMERTFRELQRLISAIDRTNSHATAEGKTLAELLIERNLLRSRQHILERLLAEASIRSVRQTKSEIRFVTTIRIPQIQKDIDALGAEYRRLDMVLQAANWSVELIEKAEDPEAEVPTTEV